MSPYLEQSPEHQKALDAWISQHYKGHDADGIKTPQGKGLGSLHSYVRWVNEAAQEMLTKELSKVGSPPVDPTVFSMGNRRGMHKYVFAASYWPQIAVEWTDEKVKWTLSPQHTTPHYTTY